MEPETIDQQEKKSSRLLNLIVITMVVLLGAVIVLAIEFSLHYRSIQQTVKTLVTGQEQVIQQQVQINQLTNAVKDLTEQQNQTQNTLTSILHVNDEQLWILKDANYLARLAQYNLLYSRDVDGAIQLLKMVDQRVSEINKPETLKVRQALANNITALQAVPKLDMAGIVTQFTALQIQVTQLPVLMPTVKPAENTAAPEIKASGSAMHRAWQSTLLVWQKLVVIRRTDEPIVPLLPEEERAYLQQNLQLLLQQALWGALHNQPKIYQASLNQVYVWVQRYFANADATAAFLQNIRELQKINVQPTYPDLTPTLNLLQNFADNVAKTVDKMPANKVSAITFNNEVDN